MSTALTGGIRQKIINWLMKQEEPDKFLLSDFEKVQYEIRSCDVLLIEGRSRISEVIKIITQSPWSHAALYIGRLHDIENPVLRERIQEFYNGPPNEQLVIESILGRGTIVSPLSNYRQDHIRICRPVGISRQDANQVIAFAISRLGTEYGIRQTLDLARFLFPWSILPKRWRSTLFQHSIGTPTKEICSSMLAEAFSSVKFPILPIMKIQADNEVKLFRRNPLLYTPSDFDYSPFFEIIKYPIFQLSAEPLYRSLPWSEEILSADEESGKKKKIRGNNETNTNPEKVNS
ncbi:MAG: hypothetical protein JSS53_01655 [Proteobacteria bacterium]|nr:hypothetical protein [Pseudomonadota bacterium]